MSVQMPIIVSKNEAVGKLETGKLYLFDYANEYFPSLISENQLFGFSVLHVVFVIFAVLQVVFAILPAVFAVERSWRCLSSTTNLT